MELTNGQKPHFYAEDSTVRIYKICSLNPAGFGFVIERHLGTVETANNRGLWLMSVLGLPTFFLNWT
jgi:hypothetical protein